MMLRRSVTLESITDIRMNFTIIMTVNIVRLVRPREFAVPFLMAIWIATPLSRYR
jgi:hypothetical protein